MFGVVDKPLTKDRMQKTNQNLLMAMGFGAVPFRYLSNPSVQEHYQLLNSTIVPTPDERTTTLWISVVAFK
jgi:hypothetical protein